MVAFQIRRLAVKHEEHQERNERRHQQKRIQRTHAAKQPIAHGRGFGGSHGHSPFLRHGRNGLDLFFHGGELAVKRRRDVAQHGAVARPIGCKLVGTVHQQVAQAAQRLR